MKRALTSYIISVRSSAEKRRKTWIELFVERSLGGPEVFLPYVKDYVSTYIGKSINTFQWKDHLFSYFKQHNPSLVADVLDKIDWNVC